MMKFHARCAYYGETQMEVIPIEVEAENLSKAKYKVYCHWADAFRPTFKEVKGEVDHETK